MLALFAAFIVILIVILCLPIVGIFTLASLKGSSVKGGFIADKEIYEYTKQEIQSELDNLKAENESISGILESNDAEFPEPLDVMSYEELNTQLEELLSVANMDFMPKGLLTKLVQTINTRVSASEEIFNHIKTKNDWRPNKNLYNYEYIKAVKSTDKHFMMLGVKHKIFNEDLLLNAKMPMLVRKELSILETDFKLSEDTRRALRLLFCMLPHKQYITENSECSKEYIDKMLLTSRSLETKKGIYDECLRFLDEYISSTIHDYPALQDIKCHVIASPSVQSETVKGSGPGKPAAKPAVPRQTVPAAKPAVPRQTVPAAKPAVPRQTVPTAKPAVPAAKPAVPAAKPAVPAAKPAVPAAKPAAKPAVPAAKPAAAQQPTSAAAIIESNSQNPLMKIAHELNDENNGTVVNHRNYYVKRPVINFLSRDPEDDSLEKNGYSDFRDNKYFKLVTNINDIHLRFLAFYISNRKRIDELLSLDDKCIDRLSNAGEKIKSMKEEIADLTKLKEQVEILRKVEENAKKTLGEKYDLEAELKKLKEGNVFILGQKIQQVEGEHALLSKDYESLLEQSRESKNDSLRSAKMAADIQIKLESTENSLLEISSRRRELEEELESNQKKMAKIEGELEDVKKDNKYWQGETMKAQIEAKSVFVSIPKFRNFRSDVSTISRQISSLTEKLNEKISRYSSEQVNIGFAISKSSISLGEKIKQLGTVSAKIEMLASLNAKVKLESNEKISNLKSQMDKLKPFFISNGFSFEYLSQHISSLESERALIIKKLAPLEKANSVDRLQSFDRLEYINRELYSQARIIERYNQLIAGTLGYSQNETKLNYSDPTFRNEYKYLLNEYKSYSTKFQRNEEMNILLRSKNNLLSEKVTELQSQNKALALVSGDELTITLKKELTKAADEIERLRKEKPEQDLAESGMKLEEAIASNEKLKSEINELETQLRSTNEKHMRELANAVDSYSSELDKELNEMLEIFEIVGNWPANSVGYADVKKKQLAVLGEIKKMKTRLAELERLNVSNERLINTQKSEIEQQQKDIISKDVVIQELRQLSGQISGIKEVSTITEQLTKENEQLKKTEGQLNERVSSLQESLKNAAVKCNSDLISKLSKYVSKVSGTRTPNDRNEIIKLLGPTAVKYGTLSAIIFDNFNKDRTQKITGRYDLDEDDLELETVEEEDVKPNKSDYWDDEEYEADLNKWTTRNTPAEEIIIKKQGPSKTLKDQFEAMKDNDGDSTAAPGVTEEMLLEFIKQKLTGGSVDKHINEIYGEMIDSCFSIAYYNTWHLYGRSRDLFVESIVDAMRYSIFVKKEATNEELSSSADTLEQDSLILGVIESTDKLTQAYQDLYKLQQKVASMRDSAETSFDKIVSMIDSSKTFMGRLKQLVGITENVSRSDLIKKLEESISKVAECDDSEINALAKNVRNQIDGIETLLSVNDKKINTMILTVNDTIKKIEVLRSYKQKYDEATISLEEANEKVKSLEQLSRDSKINVEVSQRLALARDAVVLIEGTIETLKSDYANKVNLSNREIEILKSQKEELEKRLAEASAMSNEELPSLRSQKAELEKRLAESAMSNEEVTSLRSQKTELERRLAEASAMSNEEVTSLRSQKTELERRLAEASAMSNEELNSLRSQKEELERRLAEASSSSNEEVTSLRSQKADLERRLAEASAMSNEELNSLRSQKADLERRLAEASAMSNEEVTSLRSQKAELEKQLAESSTMSNEELTSLRSQKEDLERRLAEASSSSNEEVTSLRSQKEDLERRLAEASSSSNEEVTSLRSQKEELERRLAEASSSSNEEVNSLRSQKAELERRLAEASAMSNEEVTSLRSQKAELEKQLAESSTMSNEELTSLRSQKTELERLLAEAEQRIAESELSKSSTESELVANLREQVAKLVELDRTNKSNETNMISNVIRQSFEVINVNNNAIQSVQEILSVINIIESRWQANKVTLKEYLDLSEELKAKLSESVKKVETLETQMEDLRKTQYDLESYKTAYRVLTNDKLLLDRIDESTVTSAAEEKKLFALDVKQKIENVKAQVDTFDLRTVSEKIETLKQEMLIKKQSLENMLRERKPIADLLESYERNVIELSLTVGNINDKINAGNLGLCKQLRNELNLSIQKTAELNLSISSFETKVQPTVENLKRMTRYVNNLSEIVGTMKENLLRHVDKDLESAILLGNSTLQDRLDFIKKIKSQSETVYVDVPYYITVKTSDTDNKKSKQKKSPKPPKKSSETMSRLLYRNH
jgi:chromosome segregation ATPase